MHTRPWVRPEPALHPCPEQTLTRPSKAVPVPLHPAGSSARSWLTQAAPVCTATRGTCQHAHHGVTDTYIHAPVLMPACAVHACAQVHLCTYVHWSIHKCSSSTRCVLDALWVLRGYGKHPVAQHAPSLLKAGSRAGGCLGGCGRIPRDSGSFQPMSRPSPAEGSLASWKTPFSGPFQPVAFPKSWSGLCLGGSGGRELPFVTP